MNNSIIVKWHELTWPFFSHHSKALCLFLSLKGIQVQNTEGQRDTSHWSYCAVKLGNTSQFVLSPTCMTAWVQINFWKTRHLFFLSGSPAFSKDIIHIEFGWKNIIPWRTHILHVLILIPLRSIYNALLGMQKYTHNWIRFTVLCSQFDILAEFLAKFEWRNCTAL